MIEGISYLVKRLASGACTPQSCMVDRSSFSCCNDLLIGKSYSVSNSFMKKQRPWLMKWKINQNRSVKEVKKISIQIGLGINKNSEQAITSTKEKRQRWALRNRNCQKQSSRGVL